MSANQLGFVSAIGDIDTTIRDTLGSIRYDVNGVYKYVQFGASRTGQATAQLVVGDVVCYVIGTTSDLDLLTLVDEPNSAMGAGVVVGYSTDTTGTTVKVTTTGGPYYGWVKIEGVITLSAAAGGSAVAGDALTVGPVTTASAKQVTKRGNVADGYVGVLVDATNFVIDAKFAH